MRNYTNQNNLCQVLDILLFSLNEFVNNKATKQTCKWTAQHLPIIFSIKCTTTTNNNNNDRLTAFDPGQPG